MSARRLVRAGALLLALAATGAAPARPLTGRSADPGVDDRGRPVAAARAPQRIVSLLPSMTEAVCALGDCARLVGVDNYSDYPASVAALPHLGGMEDTQVERILALKPDLVLASTSSRVLDRLEGLGLHVIALEADSLADTRRVLLALSLALARPGAGEQQWQAMEHRIAAAGARLPAAWRGRRVYFEVASTPYAAGEASFIGELLARLGLGNIVPTALGPFPQLNPEFVVRGRPDVLMADAESAAGMARRPGWQGIPALAGRRVCGFAAAQWEPMIRPGPRLGDAAGHIVDCLAALPPPVR